jgi:hypothetical protein
VNGRLVFSKKLNKLETGFNSIFGKNEFTLTTGVYFLRFNNPEINTIQKLIVQ